MAEKVTKNVRIRALMPITFPDLTFGTGEVLEVNEQTAQTLVELERAEYVHSDPPKKEA